MIRLALELYAAACVVLVVAVATVWTIASLAIYGNWRARVIAGVMAAGLVALMAWAAMTQ